MNISIIGSGNVAWHLLTEFENAGHQVREVYCRNPKLHKDMLGYTYDTVLQSHLDFSKSKSRIFIIAVSDDAIIEVASKIQLPPDSYLAHTSGSKSLEVLHVASDQNSGLAIGVFYPLMTMTRGLKIDFKKVPLLIESLDPKFMEIFQKLGNSISNHVETISAEQRSSLHLAAVFTCNFVNHLWALGKEILEEQELDFELLKPLIFETYRKGMKALHPAEVQTGPAVRGDVGTISLHQKLLKEDDDLLKVYKVLTQSIQNWHQ